jgi:hypothetical protein
LSTKREEDEIVILFDTQKGSTEVGQYITDLPKEIIVQQSNFEGHFADWKNLLTSYCTGDYIVQIDADEIPSHYLVRELHNILMQEQTPDVMLLPRVNTVDGITDKHIKSWGWNINEKGWVNWPDYQWRIYRNDPNIKWKNKVHEVLDGFKTYAAFPAEEAYCLYHPKTIDRQERQNNYYDTL